MAIERTAHSVNPLIVTASNDSIADAAMRTRRAPSSEASELSFVCDACEEDVEGEPAGSGLYLWSRGGELRVEEPDLCGNCATAIGITALAAWSVQEEEG